jgi:hypothetical protein
MMSRASDQFPIAERAALWAKFRRTLLLSAIAPEQEETAGRSPAVSKIRRGDERHGHNADRPPA